MNRQQKAEFVEAFRARIQDAPLVIVADYQGTKANDANAFRRKLDEAGVQLRVVKNTLARRAVEGLPLQGIDTYFRGMTAIMIATEEPIAAAKAVRNLLKEQDTVKLRGGFFDGELLDESGVMAVASLPSREELFVQLLRTIQEPARRILGVIRAPARDLLYLLKNFENKLAEAEGE